MSDYDAQSWDQFDTDTDEEGDEWVPNRNVRANAKTTAYKKQANKNNYFYNNMFQHDREGDGASDSDDDINKIVDNYRKQVRRRR